MQNVISIFRCTSIVCLRSENKPLSNVHLTMLCGYPPTRQFIYMDETYRKMRAASDRTNVPLPNDLRLERKLLLYYRNPPDQGARGQQCACLDRWLSRARGDENRISCLGADALTGVPPNTVK